jgi:hypothetical protein
VKVLLLNEASIAAENIAANHLSCGIVMLCLVARPRYREAAVEMAYQSESVKSNTLYCVGVGVETVFGVSRGTDPRAQRDPFHSASPHVSLVGGHRLRTRLVLLRRGHQRTNDGT